jgi:putative phosphoesterase
MKPPENTLRIGVVSDSHGHVPALRYALAALMRGGPLDALCFLGDGAGDLRALGSADGLPRAVYAVRGNNDLFADLPDQLTLTLGGQRFLLTHGHRERVKLHRLQLLLRAQEEEAQVVLFGHTHRAECGYEQGVLLLNPGAVCGARGACALVTVEQGRIRPQMVAL